MAIKRLELNGVTAFENAGFDFVPGINVLLGANSTGKTHALKWLYSTVKAFELPVAAGGNSRGTCETQARWRLPARRTSVGTIAETWQPNRAS